ncbi:MAG: gliding motility lipoprotein GldB [Bacteroidota bacterium]
MKKFLFVVLLPLVIFGCDSKSELENEISKIPIDVEVVRFDKIFGSAAVRDIPDLKAQYPMFFPRRFPDSIWEQRITDTLQQQLNKAVLDVFPSEENLEDDLQSIFQHIKYYFPDFVVPKVFTATSDVDYKNKVIATDSLLVLELDTYLGSNHPFYIDISRYITKTMEPTMLPSDVATAYARNYVALPKQRSLLSQMVYFGKQLYLKDLWLPDSKDALKIGYTEAEMQWALDNEAYIWRFFVEKELLYSTDNKLSGRFINPAPFSKFNLELDNESPGMIGRFMGWQIVRSYMEKNDVAVEELMVVSAEELFKESKYKPKK